MTELMSLEEINAISKLPESEWSPSWIEELFETARAAHEWREKALRYDLIICNLNFEEMMKMNVLAELAKARAEERERCAKACDKLQQEAEDYYFTMGSTACPQSARYCAKAIRNMNDAK